MSTTQYKYLQDYADQKQNSTAEVHSILSSMLRNFRLDAVFLVTATGVIRAVQTERFLTGILAECLH